MIRPGLQPSAERVRAAIDDGTYLGVQLFVSVEGEVWADLAEGQRTPGEELQVNSPVPWACCSKPLGALAFQRLVESGELTADTPVAVVIPEFAAAGKETVTLAHLLSHALPYDADADGALPIVGVPHEEALAVVCDRPLVAPPGTRALYSPFGSWTVLAEVVARASGRPFFEFVEAEVLRPLEMEGTLFGPARTGNDELRPSDLYQRHGGEHTVRPDLNVRLGVAPIQPGTGAHGPARELARVFECLAAEGQWQGRRIFTEHATHGMSSPRRQGLPDPTFCDLDLSWGLGVCTDPAWFGAPRGTRLAGHTGYGSSFVMADLDRRVVVCFLSTSVVDEAKGRGRLVDQIVRDVYSAVLGTTERRATRPPAATGSSTNRAEVRR
ncbi:serine hydrolase [Streptomyces sp. NPDC012616]|uniref:serine hydrolase domain-containing protein n=1 Tax=Streptomyces sp. NPDC012616 TaxID=3364840 RepID=UPI0036ED8E92